ncbi:MAG: hypothetical protein Q4F82_01065 [bacterium]|nr:hypothetical protein [bacterium]
MVLLFLVMFFSCSHKPSPPEEDMLYRVECFLQQKPDSAMQILDTLNLSALSDKERAHYCLLQLEVLFNTRFYDTEIDSLLQVADNEFAGGDDKYFEAWSYYAKGYAYRSSPQHRWLCIDNFLKAKQSIDQCKQVDARLVRFKPTPTTEQDVIDRLKYKIYSGLGSAYGDFGYHTEAMQVLKEAEQSLSERQWFDQHCYTALMISELYLRFKEYDSSAMYLEKGFHSAEMTGDVQKLAACHSSAALNALYRYEKQEQTESEDGPQLLREAIMEEKSALRILDDQTAKFKASVIDGLAHAYFELNQYDSCIYFAQQAVDQYGLEVWKMNANMYLYKSYEALGQMDSAIWYAEKYMDSRQKYDRSGKSVAEVKDEYDRQMELQRVENVHQTNRLKLYLLIALLVIALLLLWLFVNRYRKKKEMEATVLRETQHQLQSDLETAEQHSQELLLKRTNVIYKSEEKDKLRRIMAEFEAAYPQAMEKLKSAYPDLNENECTVAVLNFLGFRIKEEAALLNLSENTVMKYRSNLKKTAGSDPISPLLG